MGFPAAGNGHWAAEGERVTWCHEFACPLTQALYVAFKARGESKPTIDGDDGRSGLSPFRYGAQEIVRAASCDKLR